MIKSLKEVIERSVEDYYISDLETWILEGSGQVSKLIPGDLDTRTGQ